MRRATKDTFDPELPSTIGLDYSAFEAVLDGELWRVEIWDTAGQDRFRTIQKAYYRSADGEAAAACGAGPLLTRAPCRRGYTRI